MVGTVREAVQNQVDPRIKFCARSEPDVNLLSPLFRGHSEVAAAFGQFRVFFSRPRTPASQGTLRNPCSSSVSMMRWRRQALPCNVSISRAGAFQFGTSQVRVPLTTRAGGAVCPHV